MFHLMYHGPHGRSFFTLTQCRSELPHATDSSLLMQSIRSQPVRTWPRLAQSVGGYIRLTEQVALRIQCFLVRRNCADPCCARLSSQNRPTMRPASCDLRWLAAAREELSIAERKSSGKQTNNKHRAQISQQGQLLGHICGSSANDVKIWLDFGRGLCWFTFVLSESHFIHVGCICTSFGESRRCTCD